MILPSNAHIDRQIIRAAPRLALIQQPAAGYEGIDLAAAEECGIPVCNAPGANPISVAEAALHLMLRLMRRQNEASIGFAQAIVGEPVGRELSGKHLGIVGMGRSGRHLAAVGSALGMEVAGATSQTSPDALRELLSQSDVISLHCPLTERTLGLIDERAFAVMKPDAVLINCARGPIIDRSALDRALARDAIGGVGLDVFWDEPWAPDDPLFGDPRVVTMPHTAGSTVESYSRIAGIVSENVARIAAGKSPLHQVSPVPEGAQRG